MSYTRQYPLNITPDGDDIETVIDKVDNEFNSIIGELNSIGVLQLFSTKRQSVLYGPTDDNGNPNYLSANGFQVSIDGSNKPLYLAFANGFNDNGTVDFLDKISSVVSNAWTLPANQTCYLYVDKDADTGLLSYGYSLLTDLYQDVEPTSPTLDQHWFNTIEMKMYRWNGSTWEEKLRLFICKAICNLDSLSLSIYKFISNVPFKSNLAQKIVKKDNLDDDLQTFLSDVVTKDELDNDVQALLSVSDVNMPGLSNFIMNGMKLIPVTDLSLSVDVGRALIGEKVHNLTAQQSVALSARMAALIYAQKSADSDVPTIGKVEAADPVTFVDNNTVALWKFNQTAAGTHIPNSAAGISSIAVANDLVPSGGLTSVDGWNDYAIKGDGNTGYYTLSNTTGIPAYASPFHLQVFIPNFTGGVTQCFYHDGVRKVATDASNNLLIGGVNTRYTLENGKAYLIDFKGAGGTTNGNVSVNGFNVYTGAIVANATVVAPKILANTSNTEKSPSTIAYVHLSNIQKSDVTISQMANKLLLPNFYTDTDGTRKSITSVLPADSISLGFVRTNSTAVITKNDTDFMFGRREKAVGGNRKAFLGWKYFSGQTTLTWTNPFGTRKIKTYYTWSQDANGTNESDIVQCFYYGSSQYGIESTNTCTDGITITTASYGAASFNGVFQTSGYIGCYAEVLEDDN